MKIYNMPPKALEVLLEIADLSPAASKELSEFVASNLEKLPGPEEAYELTSKLSPKRFDTAQAFRWMHSLVPMIFEILSTAQDAQEVVSDLVSAAQRELAEGEIEVPAATIKKMRANLLSVFDNPQTKLKAKSLRLLNTHDRRMTECEIVSDIRPIFRADGKVSIEAAVMYHTLRLSHAPSGESFFISLDSQDLTKLAKAIERASQKELAISKLLQNAGVEQVKVS